MIDELAGRVAGCFETRCAIAEGSAAEGCGWIASGSGVSEA